MVTKSVAELALRACNPRPSCVSDPDGLLSCDGRAAVDRVLKGSRYDIGFAILGTLQLPKEKYRSASIVSQVARVIYNAWAIGRDYQGDGALYVMAYHDRKHHVYAGPKIMHLLNHGARTSVLEAAAPWLRAGNVDRAVLAAARRLVSLLGRSATRRALDKYGGVIFVLAMLLGMQCFRVLVTFWRKRRLRAEAEVKLRHAWERSRGFEDGMASFRAPCVVCMEPLTTVSQEWMAELALSQRGHLAVPWNASPGLQVLSHLPRPLQRRVVSFVGPSLDSFLCNASAAGGALSCTGACADGVELFKCGHVLHNACADSWLREKKSCPTCRLPNPRIAALVTLPAAFATAQAMQQPNGWTDFIDAATDVSYQIESNSYIEHRASSVLNSLGDLGGGGSSCGGGTSGDW